MTIKETLDVNEPKRPKEEKAPLPAIDTGELAGPDYKVVYDMFHAKAAQVAKAKRVWTDAAEIAKDLKKSYEYRQDELLEIGVGPPKTPLFDQAKTPAEDWRKITIDSIGLKPGIVKALTEKNKIATVGALVDFQAKHTTFWLKEIKGVGVEGGTEIDKAMEQVWIDNPQAENDGK